MIMNKKKFFRITQVGFKLSQFEFLTTRGDFALEF